MTDQRRDFDATAATWDEVPGRVCMAEAVARAVVEELHPDGAVTALDFGCGTGLVTLALRPHVRSITGVDASEGMLAVLRSKIEKQGLRNVRTQLVLLDDPALPEEPFTLVVASMVLHHVRRIEPLLARFFSALHPGGQVALADLDPEEGQFHYPDRTGVFHDGFDRARLRAALEGAGFTDIRDRTAATVEKEVEGGRSRAFTIFLMVGRKP